MSQGAECIQLDIEGDISEDAECIIRQPGLKIDGDVVSQGAECIQLDIEGAISEGADIKPHIEGDISEDAECIRQPGLKIDGEVASQGAECIQLDIDRPLVLTTCFGSVHRNLMRSVE